MIESMILLEAPAKVNLWLKIIGKRSDGFHELETLMAPLRLSDEISIGREESGIFFECSGGGSDVTGGPDNLAWRAAAAYFEKVRGGARIALKKNIPSGAGLGGGSSDAASVLLGLQELYGNALPGNELLGIAAKLGSDVPFFLLRGAGLCRGRGEILEPRSFSWGGSLLLVKPPFPVPTPWAYAKYAELAAGKPRGKKCSEEEGEPVFSRNDLEEAVFSKYLVLKELKQWLKSRPGACGAMLCGSGATVFGAFQERGDAENASSEVREVFGESFWVCLTGISLNP